MFPSTNNQIFYHTATNKINYPENQLPFVIIINHLYNYAINVTNSNFVLKRLSTKVIHRTYTIHSTINKKRNPEED